MQIKEVNQYFGNLDIYLLDQILKERFHPSMKVLDAGCGEGRNLTYFLNSGYEVYGIDQNPEAIRILKFLAASKRPDMDEGHFVNGLIENMPYQNQEFDLVIASAVLHFAHDHQHFQKMFQELARCLKPSGILFMRMTSNIGLTFSPEALGAGRFLLPDGTERYLLEKAMLVQLMEKHHMEYLEPLKTVHVAELRSMSTIVLGKVAG
ncbi:MAG: class I SAM-dependent methyltransferase [Cyclobacteriaceae bacterium]|nr:class I SAM-dependent methyltransferase [Cyclobacteriaceae bacterium]